MRPLVFSRWKDPEDAHEFIMARLEQVQRNPLLLSFLAATATVTDPALQRNLFGLQFRNPIGLGGGFDKNARAIRGFEALGFGFIEIGTVTWHPQPGNPRPRVFRYPNDKAIINRFGFNNEGAQKIAERLAADTKPRKAVLGISLGKSKITELDDAVDDYLSSLRVLYPHGDYFAVNVSSPNTPGLRQLQDKDALDDLLAALDEEGQVLQRKSSQPDEPNTHTQEAPASQPTKNSALQPTQNENATSPNSPDKPDPKPISAPPPSTACPRKRKPILVKIAPDLEPQALDELLEVCTRRNIDGVIATNTTLSRDGLNTPTEEAGGLSGAPLYPRSLAIIRHIRNQLPDIPIIGVGGIMTPLQAQEMINAGANLLQIYTALIYEGPYFCKELNKALIDNSLESA